MIGDTFRHDILPAIEIGIRAVWVLARPEREIESLIRILNNKAPSPTATVAGITDITNLDIWN